MSTIHSSPVHFIPPSTVGTTGQVLTATNNVGNSAWQNPMSQNFVFTNVQFVAKGGNDLNDGFTLDTPKLTLESALANITSEGMIWILDSNFYTCNLNIAFTVSLFAPAASFDNSTFLVVNPGALILTCEYLHNSTITVEAAADLYIEVSHQFGSSVTAMPGSFVFGKFDQQYFNNFTYNNNLNVNGTLIASGLQYPTSDASNGYVMTTNGAGVLSLQPVSADVPPNGIQIFVSQAIGNDANSGTYLAPLATFGAAITLAGAPPSTQPVIIIGLDGNLYDEQLVINNPNVYISAPFAQLNWSGAGDTLTINASTFGTLIKLGVIYCSGGGNSIVNNMTETVILDIIAINSGAIVNNGAGNFLILSELIQVDINNLSTGLISLQGGFFTGNTTNTGGGIIVYDASIRTGTDGTGVYGINPFSSTAPTFTVKQLTASGLNYPTTDSTAGNVITTDGAGNLTLQPPATGFTSINVQTFTSSGTYTPTAGMSYCIVECVGGGGGGGGADSGVGVSAAAGGGGGGAYAKSILSAGTIGGSQAVTVGTGGSGGAAGNNNGTNGSSSSLGALVEADGGSGGFGSATSATTPSFGIYGAGGGSGTGQIVKNGDSGFLGLAWGASHQGVGGQGGNSFYGIGGEQLINLAGANGFNYGSGGGGGSSGNTGAVAGGNGANGVVIITEYIG